MNEKTKIGTNFDTIETNFDTVEPTIRAFISAKPNATWSSPSVYWVS
jgi:hypothetical protein